MDYSHTPVLLEQCLEGLSVKPDGIYVDGTVGGGGHAAHILEKLSSGRLIGIDRDADAIEAASVRLGQLDGDFKLVRGNYAEAGRILKELGIDGIDGALLDLGVSSYQLDNPERGFSYMHDAPLDMRMDQSAGITAEDVVNSYSEEELTRVIQKYGEERWASRISEFVVRERKKKRIATTGELTEIIKKAIPASARRTGPHPAKRTFQAIRIEVNDELNRLERAVEEFCDLLNPGGRICVITFHSLEDRTVKQIFQRRENPCICPPEFPVCVCGRKPDMKRINKKPVTADEEEIRDNPRARSAGLRIAEKLPPAEQNALRR